MGEASPDNWPTTIQPAPGYTLWNGMVHFSVISQVARDDHERKTKYYEERLTVGQVFLVVHSARPYSAGPRLASYSD